jgi:hypothetical protein
MSQNFDWDMFNIKERDEVQNHYYLANPEPEMEKVTIEEQMNKYL